MQKTLFLLMLGWIVACSPAHEPELDHENEVPEENRFSKEVFLTNLTEPTELDVMHDGRILFVQRRGEVILYDPELDEQKLLDVIPVYYQQEDGLMGMALDPNFENNRWVYLYYSPVGDEPKQHLSRFRFTENGLRDEVVMLEVPTQREECCHTGGSIQFGGDGLLYLSTGDDTNPFASNGYGPIDEQPGRSSWDAQRSSGNTNDLRGKILRIKPLPDGSYAIPEGNLFEDDDPLTRPEIYVMGCRNPYRIGVDGKRGWLYWGDVGPDAQFDSDTRGTRGYDEFNLAMAPGYFGWPYFVGPNSAYNDYNFLTKVSGSLFNPEKPINDSPNNTGKLELPPVKEPLVYYPYANIEKFPMVGNGSRTAMAGPVYYSSDYEGNERFPSYFDGRAMYYDWMRGHLFFIGLTDEGEISDWYRLMPDTEFSNPVDFEYGPDGRLYLLEYGTRWNAQNENATLSRINYIRGNRPPILEVTTTELQGKEPLTVTFDASASFDYDKDNLYFNWEIDGNEFKDAVVTYTFEKQGIYYPELILRDPKNNKVRKQFKIAVGNNPPEIDIELSGNKTFFWRNRVASYAVKVQDAEDGSLGQGIFPDDVDFSINHYQSFDQAEALGHQSPVISGKQLMESLDCKSCHQIDATSVGPSYIRVAARYEKTKQNQEYLINKIINGGGGVWGEHVMAAHPELSREDAGKIVEFVLSLREGAYTPLEGSYKFTEPEGTYHFVASYEDHGKGNIQSITRNADVWLRSTRLEASGFDFSKNVKTGVDGNGQGFISDIFHESHVGFSQIDLTDIAGIEVGFRGVRTGKVSIRNGSPTGKEIGVGEVFAERTYPQNKLFIKIDRVSEKNDIYFVFLNEESDDLLFSIHNFTFVPDLTHDELQ
ncbi:MAG: PQQ-dependent sugar dehydrogenase [Cyclobacteriaceae bacterium]